MCLIKTHRFPKISRKPVKCYKYVDYIGNNEYKTLVIGYPFKLGDIIKSARHWIFGIFNVILTDEVVHAYKTKGKFLIDEIDETWIECEITPFTPYWISYDGDIGAARIRTIKEV